MKDKILKNFFFIKIIYSRKGIFKAIEKDEILMFAVNPLKLFPLSKKFPLVTTES